MKLSRIFLVMVIIFAIATLGIVAAEEATLSGHTFTIPDGFKKVDSGSADQIALAKGSDEAIALTINNDIKLGSELRAELEKDGYKYIGEETYDVDGIEVTQQNYNKDGNLFMAYTFKAGSEKCFVTYVIPESQTPPEGAANPVSTILASIN